MFSRLFEKNPKKIKISEMLIKVAGDYIAMREDVSDKQELLNAAVSAWNIACLKSEKRQEAINKFMKKYKKLNPGFSKNDFRDEEENIRLLIKQKEILYPKVNVQIVNAVIQEIDGKSHIAVASAKIDGKAQQGINNP
jgi:predicted  nucleic acid-binding Zn ribbon protein